MEAPCLGTQLIEIINLIQPFTKTYVWYGCDMETNGHLPFKHGLRGWIPKRIGTNASFITLADEVDQFLSGVFLAVSKDHGGKLSNPFGTEDEPFRDLEEAVLEIRAFDTSYFEIYTSNKALIESLANHFTTPIIEG